MITSMFSEMIRAWWQRACFTLLPVDCHDPRLKQAFGAEAFQNKPQSPSQV